MNGHTSWDVRLAISFQILDDFLQSIWLDFQTFIHIHYFLFFSTNVKVLTSLASAKNKKKHKRKECKKKHAKDSRN
jgi:hypothetical protein